METSRRKSLILLSGGLDSSANLAFAQHFDSPALALTIDYGQLAAVPEMKAAAQIAAYYGVPHRIIEMKWLGELGGSALTSKNISVPKLTSSELDNLKMTKPSAKAVWVPNRNGLFINVAAAIAESMQIPQVIVGFNKEEAETFPDNSSQFIGVSTLALRYSTSNGVKVICYTDIMVKSEIVRALQNLEKPFPFDMIWGCYLGGEKPCGECESCQRDLRATAQISENKKKTSS